MAGLQTRLGGWPTNGWAHMAARLLRGWPLTHSLHYIGGSEVLGKFGDIFPIAC